MKRTFLTYEKPLLTCMVQADNPARIKELITRAREGGAEAFGMQFCRLKAKDRTRETYRDLFDFAAPQPTYVTNYRATRGGENGGKSEEQLAAELLELAECGATLCDVMGDFFAPTEGELTTDPAAVAKQTALVEALHERGAEVLMSSHVLKFIPAEQVLEIARAHQSRGADISKIVTGASTMAEQIENLRIVELLGRELQIPFLFLSGGESRILRRIGGTLGNCMTLCVQEHDAFSTKAQPLLSDVKLLRDKLEL